MNTQTPTVTPSKPTDLKGLVALVESNNNPFAVRYEISYMNRTLNADIAASNWKCSYGTAIVLMACSWGKYQIMGLNLFRMGLKVSPVAYCADDIMQDSMFLKYCILNKCNYSLDDILNDENKRLDFAKKYNGSSNINTYADLLMRKYNEF